MLSLRAMMRAFRNLVERQIGKAAAEGGLSGLQGEGKPLPDRSSEALVDPALAAGHRIMAQAGVLPEEFKIKAELEEARRAWQDSADGFERQQDAGRADLRVSECGMALVGLSFPEQRKLLTPTLAGREGE